MKKIALLLFAALVLALLVPKTNEMAKLSEHEMYLQDHEFHFLVFHTKDDAQFLQKIYSMIDQEYDNFQIHLYIDEEERQDIHQVETFAKMKSKEHLLTIIEKKDDAPIEVIRENILKTLPPNSVGIELNKHCFFAQKDILTTLNKAFKESTSPICLYSNYTKAPSYKTNKEPFDFLSSSFRAAYVFDLLTNKLSKEYFLDEPLYISSAEEENLDKR